MYGFWAPEISLASNRRGLEKSGWSLESRAQSAAISQRCQLTESCGASSKDSTKFLIRDEVAGQRTGWIIHTINGTTTTANSPAIVHCRPVPIRWPVDLAL